MKETTVVIGEDLLVAGGRSKKHMDELLEKIPISFMERANYSFFFYERILKYYIDTHYTVVLIMGLQISAKNGISIW